MYLKRMPLTLCAALVITLSACSKQELKQNAVMTKPVFDEPAALKKFLAVTLNISQDKIVYDEQKKTFSVPNTVFIENYDAVKVRYSEANEYKLNNPD
jgi:uncharacterized lipoprotein